MRFGIRPQAVLIAGVPLVFLLLLLAVASLLISHTEQSRHATEVVTQSQEMIETLDRADRAVQEYVHSRRLKDLQPYQAAAELLPQQERRLRQSVQTEPDLLARSDFYVRDVQRAFTVLTAYTTAMRNGDAAALQRIVNAPATREASADVERSQLQFENAARLRQPGSPQQRRASLQRLERMLLVSVLAGIVLTVLVSLLFGVYTVRRLRLLGDNARRLADGVPAVPVGGNDEISELDAIYRVMADRIQTSSRAHEQILEELERERSDAALLQKTLLPDIPAIDGLHIDTAYATPAEGAQIGGDWFDVFALSETLVGLSVGDVTGHGLRAVASMGFIRQAIRVVARLDAEPANVMARVNRIVCAEKASIASAFFGVYDRGSGRLVYAIAGHGPPLVATPAGGQTLLDGAGLLLGLDPEARFAASERGLEPGDALVLYTDGIVEAERDYFKGMADLEKAVRAELTERSPNLAEGIQQRVFSQAPPRDDSALLVLEILSLAQPPNAERPIWRFDARDQGASWRVKRELLAALAALGPFQPDLTVAELVYGELISNVVRHTPGAAQLTFGLESGHVALTLEDHGPPLRASIALSACSQTPDANAESGRGLFIIKALCRNITIDPIHDGKRTTVVLPLASDGNPLLNTAAM